MSAVPTLQIRVATGPGDFTRGFPVLNELRPHLTLETFLSAMERMRSGGYVFVLGESGGQIVAVAGYRLSEHLARGRFMYVDDLVTLHTALRHGHGKQMLGWLVETARQSACAEIHLDSGVQRAEAHAFYEAMGMRFSSRHYSLKLNS